MNPESNVSRRDFLKASSILGGGLLISFMLPPGSANAASKVASTETTFNAFLKIKADNTIQISLSKIEMGQGIWTTLTMLIAEELDCDWENIQVEHLQQQKGNKTNDSIFQASTGGSDTTRSEFDRYRMAGATARAMLIRAAALRLGVEPKECHTDKGYVINVNKRIPYGDLADDAARLPVPQVNLRNPSEWKFIGKTRKRLDSPKKNNGQALYGIDVQFPGLLTAVMSYPPVFGGKVKSFNADKAMTIKGVQGVFEIPTGIAVLADHYWAAKLGCNALEINWDVDKVKVLNSKTQAEEYSKLAETRGKVSQYKGDAELALQNAAQVIEAEFLFPYLSHSPMEPLNCTVKISEDKCEVWVGTQGPNIKQQEIAKYLGWNVDQVTLTTPHLGGSFGRRGTFYPDWIIDTVEIARTSLKPIKLVWSREDDIKGGYYRPMYLHKVKIAIESGRFPKAWQHRIVGQSQFIRTILEEYIVRNGIDYSSVDGVQESPYLEIIPDHSVELHTTECEVPVLPWRSVGNTHTAFVMETLVDELAIIAGRDPLDYRLEWLKHHPRYIAVLKLLETKADWKKPMQPGKFRGIAIHRAMGSIVAQVVELYIKDRKINVHRVVCVIDCGLAVNPDGIIAQMEGGIVFGLTAALYGEITIIEGLVQQSNFHNYRMLRMDEAPLIEVHILPSTEKIGGAGEPGVPPIAPALANALFAATGKRVRSLPVRLNDLL